jgi:hypothetical protein
MNRRRFLMAASATGLGVAGACHARPSGADARAAQRRGDLAGETVNVLDYCSANGRGSDAPALQALIDRDPDVLLYPARTRLVLDRPIRLRSHQTHRFATGAALTSETPGYALQGVGETSGTLGTVTQAIARYTNRIALDRRPELAIDDAIILADVGDPADIKTDVNVVAGLSGSTIITRYPVGRPFERPADLRVYYLYRPLERIVFEGALKAENLHPEGGVLQLVNSRNMRVDGFGVVRAGYIGIAVENSLEGALSRLAVSRTGASGLGIRSSKALTLNNFTASGVGGDESLTFYENVSQVTASGIRIRQYLHGKDPGGGGAGNNVLIDRFCSRIKLADLDCSGSATYNVMIHNHCDDCEVSDFRLAQANLGGIRISVHSHRNKVGQGSIAQVVDAVDQERRRPTAAIAIGDSCTGTVLASDLDVSAANTGRAVDRWKDAVNSR